MTEIRQWYLQSHLAVRFLVDQWGEESLGALLTAFSEREAQDVAIEKVTGRDFETFEKEYQDWVKRL